jgi:tetratricopeptide (TPR) repeat protein
MRKIIKLMRDPIPRLGKLIGDIPPPPPHFQPRVDEVSALANLALLDTVRNVDVKASDRIIVVHGMPGSGKSALVAAFGRSTETRRAFGDGILWISVGSAPSEEGIVETVCRELAGVPVRMRKQRDVATRLREALAGKACLILLDDVWSIDPVAAFIGTLSPRSRLVVTTRLAELTSSLASPGLLVGSLTEQSALRHLADWTGTPVDELPGEAREVARECGYLPFALALCGAMAQDGLRWIDLLEKLRAANLGFIEKRIRGYPYTNFLRAMSVSLDQLSKERKDASRRYRELAVFQSGKPIPLAAVITLWTRTGKLDEPEARKILAILQGKSLLRIGEPSEPSITLHDLQWDFLSASVPDAAPLHRTLIAAFDRRHPDGFQNAPRGDYIVERACMHLALAGEHNRLYQLIDRPWFERKSAREALRRSFLEDVDWLLQVAQERFAQDLNQFMRGCLIRASIASLAVEVPSDALYVLGQCGQSEQALDAAKLAEDPVSQSVLCSSIAAGLKARGLNDEAKELALQAVAIADSIPGQRSNMFAWAAMLLAELGDAGAAGFIDRAWKACIADARTYAIAGAMMQTAIAAFKSGRRRDAGRMMRAAEQERHLFPYRVDPNDHRLAEIAEGWMLIDNPRQAMRLIERRLKEMRRDRSAKSWSPEVQLLGQAALAWARAGRDTEAERLWRRTVKANRRRRDFDLEWYGILVSARLGRPQESARWIRRATSRASQTTVQDHTNYLSAAARELSAAGRRREALRFADRALTLIRKDRAGSPEDTLDERDPLHREPGIMANCALTYIECGDQTKATALALDALATATRFRWDSRSVGEAKAAIAEAFAQIGLTKRAESVAIAIEDDYARGEGFEKVVRALAMKGLYKEARSIAMRITEPWNRSQAIAGAIRSVRPPALRDAVKQLEALIVDANVHFEVRCWLARFCSQYLDTALEAYSKLDDNLTEFDAVIHLASALHRPRNRKEAAAIMNDLWRALPAARGTNRGKAAEALTHLLVFQEARGELQSLIEAADVADTEYAACALSRVALVFAEAGWSNEAETAVSLAAERASRIGIGRPHGKADVYARLVNVMVRMGDAKRVIAYAKEALATLATKGGWEGSYAYPHEVRRAVGRSIGRILEPQVALDLIIGSILPEGEDRGYVGDSLIGLYETVLADRGRRSAERLELSIAKSRAGQSAWLSARMASIRHAHKDYDQALGLLRVGLAKSVRGDACTVLDVIEHGATVVAGIDRGRTLERVYRSLLEVQRWSAPAPGRA